MIFWPLASVGMPDPPSLLPPSCSLPYQLEGHLAAGAFPISCPSSSKDPSKVQTLKAAEFIAACRPIGCSRNDDIISEFRA